MAQPRRRAILAEHHGPKSVAGAVRRHLDGRAAEPWPLTRAFAHRPVRCQWTGRILFERDEPDPRLREAMRMAFWAWYVVEYKPRQGQEWTMADAQFISWMNGG